jgi:transcriptional regulator with XRE-family HTH domain
MASNVDVEGIVRQRLRSLRLAQGWSLDELAERSQLGVSTLSRIETGKRTISLDVLQPLCRALHIDISTLIDVSDDDEVVIRPLPMPTDTGMVWPLTRTDSTRDVIAAKWRLEPTDTPHDLRVHPGYDWFYVLSGAVALLLGDRRILVNKGEAAEFSTMTPHSIKAHQRPTEIITIFNRTGHIAHHG